MPINTTIRDGKLANVIATNCNHSAYGNIFADVLVRILPKVAKCDEPKRSYDFTYGDEKIDAKFTVINRSGNKKGKIHQVRLSHKVDTFILGIVEIDGAFHLYRIPQNIMEILVKMGSPSHGNKIDNAGISYKKLNTNIYLNKEVHEIISNYRITEQELRHKYA